MIGIDVDKNKTCLLFVNAENDQLDHLPNIGSGKIAIYLPKYDICALIAASPLYWLTN